MDGMNEYYSNNNDYFFVSRVRLERAIIDAGLAPGVAQASLYLGTARTEWKHEQTPELVQFVTDYYEAIGKPVPHSLNRAMMTPEQRRRNPATDRW